MTQINRVSYPIEVENGLRIFLDPLREYFKGPNFPIGYHNLAYTHAWNELGKIFLKRQLDGLPILDPEAEESIVEAMELVVTEINLMSLYDQGLVNTIEDENGDNVWFITDKGDQVAKEQILSKLN